MQFKQYLGGIIKLLIYPNEETIRKIGYMSRNCKLSIQTNTQDFNTLLPLLLPMAKNYQMTVQIGGRKI